MDAVDDEPRLEWGLAEDLPIPEVFYGVDGMGRCQGTVRREARDGLVGCWRAKVWGDPTPAKGFDSEIEAKLWVEERWRQYQIVVAENVLRFVRDPLL